MGAEIFHTLKKALKDAGHNTNVGDEGGFAPGLASADEALTFIMKAIEKAGYRPGEDVFLALDCAATEFFKDGALSTSQGEGKVLSSDEMAKFLADLVAALPDHLHRGRHGGGRLGRLEGADRHRSARAASSSATISSSPTRSACAQGIEQGVANAILVKVNQIGTLTETLDAVETAHKAGYRAVMSHRSGETEDSTIADLAVATNCGQIKTGSLARSDRTAKYNQLIRIEEELGPAASYAGRAVLR